MADSARGRARLAGQRDRRGNGAMGVGTRAGEWAPDGLQEQVDILGPDDVPGPAEFWLRHLWAGLLLFACATLLSAGYLYLTPDGPHRGAEWVMVFVSALSVGVVVALPRRAIARSPRRLVFFVAWSAFSCVF